MTWQTGRGTLDICLWLVSDPCLVVVWTWMGQEWIAGSVPRSNRGFLILLGRGVFESGSGGPSRVNGALW